MCRQNRQIPRKLQLKELKSSHKEASIPDGFTDAFYNTTLSKNLSLHTVQFFQAVVKEGM